MTAENRVTSDERVEENEHSEDDSGDREACADAATGEEDGCVDDDGTEEDDLHDAHPQRCGRRTHDLLNPAGTPFGVDDRDHDDEPQKQGQVVVARVRADLRKVAGADDREAVRNGDRVGVTDDLVAAAEDEHAGQGDDEGGNPDVGNPRALPGADQHSHEQPEQDGQRPREVPVPHRGGHHDADESGNGSDRQVDVAGDDHHDHADGEDEDIGVLADQVDQVAGRQRQSVGQVLEEQNDGDQAEEDAELPQVRAAAAEDLLQITKSAFAGTRVFTHML